MTRPSWFEYGMALAETARLRSEDPHVQVGAVVMRRDYSIAGIGYNGAAPGVEIDWSDREYRRDLVIHAEVNALRYTTVQETRRGLVFVTGVPCPACLAVIASHGIRTVYYGELLQNYPIGRAQFVAEQVGIHLRHQPLKGSR